MGIGSSIMYYLRREAIRNDNGNTITPDRAVYKDNRLSRFYRGDFTNINGHYQGMKVYTCKTLKKILELRKAMFEYSGEWFDIYDENGKVIEAAIQKHKNNGDKEKNL